MLMTHDTRNWISQKFCFLLEHFSLSIFSHRSSVMSNFMPRNNKKHRLINFLDTSYQKTSIIFCFSISSEARSKTLWYKGLFLAICTENIIFDKTDRIGHRYCFQKKREQKRTSYKHRTYKLLTYSPRLTLY